MNGLPPTRVCNSAPSVNTDLRTTRLHDEWQATAANQHHLARPSAKRNRLGQLCVRGAVCIKSQRDSRLMRNPDSNRLRHKVLAGMCARAKPLQFLDLPTSKTMGRSECAYWTGDLTVRCLLLSSEH